MFGVTPHDPVTFVAVPVLLLMCAALAAFVPARRAAAANPASILQE
jgi:ABC-type lipoprotein release transport system permease subunit